MRAYVLPAVLSIVLGGCASSAPNAEQPARSPQLSSVQPNALPAELSSLESAAEDAYDHALSGASAQVLEDARKLASTWARFEPDARRAGAPQDTLTRTTNAIANLERVSRETSQPIPLARAANAVSAPMAQLFTLYHPRVPPNVLALDYLGREVALDAMEGNRAAARLHVRELADRWHSLRPEVLATGGAREATAYDASIARLSAAVERATPGRVAALAKDNLDLVDSLEKVFERTA